MALARHALTIQDDDGNIVDGATVTVTNEAGGLGAPYSDRAGLTPLGNPFVAASGADAGFHIAGGAYRIDAALGGLSRTWRYVGIGTNAETDVPENPNPAFLTVLDFGAEGDGSTDDTAAFQAAADSVTTTPTTIYVPSGRRFRITDEISINGKPVVFRGDGHGGGIIAVDMPDGIVFDFDGTGSPYGTAGVIGLCFAEDQEFDGTLIRADDYENFICCDNRAATGGTHYDIDAIFLHMTGNRSEIYSGCFWKHRGFGGVVSNNIARNHDFSAYRPGKYCKPTIWLNATSAMTSLQVSNCNFGGHGSAKRHTVSAISHDASGFVATVGSPHKFHPGERIIVEDASNASYNGTWLISAIAATTVTVAVGSDLGAVSTGFTLRSLSVDLYFDSTGGAINETSWSNILFENIQGSRPAGSCSVQFDGLNNSSNGMRNHGFSNCYLDCGQWSLDIAGSNNATVYNVSGISFTDCRFIASAAAIRLLQTTACFFTNCRGYNVDTTLTSASEEYTKSACVLFQNDSGFVPSTFIFFSNCSLGRHPENANETVFSFQYGVRFVYDTGSDIYFNGCHLFGLLGHHVIDGGSGVLSGARIFFSGGSMVSATAVPLAADTITTVATAASVTLPLFRSVFKTSGTTTITTLAGDYVGREIILIPITGHSIALASGTKALSANVAYKLVCIADNSWVSTS